MLSMKSNRLKLANAKRADGNRGGAAALDRDSSFGGKEADT